MKKYLFLIAILFNIANCSELAYPWWYCNTYEDKYYIYSCSHANSRYDSVKDSIKNISDYIYGKLNLNQEYEPIIYRKFDLIYTSKTDKVFFTKVSLSKNELLTLYKEKLKYINKEINEFINKDISPLIKYKNKKELLDYISIAKIYIKIINLLSKDEVKINFDVYNRAENYIKNIKLDINIILGEDIPQEFLSFLKIFFELNGIYFKSSSDNVLYIDAKNVKDFINNLYHVNSNLEFRLMYKNKLQLYNYINLQETSSNDYEDATHKIFLKFRTIIGEKDFEIFNLN